MKSPRDKAMDWMRGWQNGAALEFLSDADDGNVEFYAGFHKGREVTMPRLLDLFCGAGGCAMGYHRAGFDVVGVDIVPQPRYPFCFIQADAMTYPLSGFDVIHASPPCQTYSALARFAKEGHKALVGPVREMLMASKKTYVIENVVGAPLIKPIVMCGSYFGLRVRRHRLFESNIKLRGTYCTHNKQGQPLCVAGTGGKRINRRAGDNGGACNYPSSIEEASHAMGIDWMTRKEISQAIPPAYTEFIGKQLMEAVR